MGLQIDKMGIQTRDRTYYLAVRGIKVASSIKVAVKSDWLKIHIDQRVYQSWSSLDLSVLGEWWHEQLRTRDRGEGPSPVLFPYSMCPPGHVMLYFGAIQ